MLNFIVVGYFGVIQKIIEIIESFTDVDTHITADITTMYTATHISRSTTRCSATMATHIASMRTLIASMTAHIASRLTHAAPMLTHIAITLTVLMRCYIRIQQIVYF